MHVYNFTNKNTDDDVNFVVTLENCIRWLRIVHRADAAVGSNQVYRDTFSILAISHVYCNMSFIIQRCHAPIVMTSIR